MFPTTKITTLVPESPCVVLPILTGRGAQADESVFADSSVTDNGTADALRFAKALSFRRVGSEMNMKSRRSSLASAPREGSDLGETIIDDNDDSETEEEQPVLDKELAGILDRMLGEVLASSRKCACLMMKRKVLN